MEIKRERFSDDEIIDKVLGQYYDGKNHSHNLQDVIDDMIGLTVKVTELEYKHIEDLMLMNGLFTDTEIKPDRLYKISTLGKKIQSKKGWLRCLKREKIQRPFLLFDIFSKPFTFLILLVTIIWNICTSRTNIQCQQQLKQTTDSTKQVLQDLDLRYKTNIEKTEQLQIKVDSLAKSDTTSKGR
ncbi:MAG: hypothetical protein IPH33_09000 [Bacteroidetes bacterium]|jgi:hypothetical protein|nr:hypothetical protein [Bacteroidota bacterium]